MNSSSSWQRRFSAAIRLAVFLAAAFGFLFFGVTFSPLISWWGGLLAGPWDDPTGEVLIVLGSEVQDDGIIGGSSYWRSVYAVRAWREGGFRQVVVSGGGKAVTPIAAPMRDFLVSSGVPPEVIQIEVRAGSTRESALYLKPLLDRMPGRKVLLTSDYHMFRAHRVFRKAGLEVLPRPFPDAGKRGSVWIGRWPAFLDLLTETIKIGYYSVRGWI